MQHALLVVVQASVEVEHGSAVHVVAFGVARFASKESGAYPDWQAPWVMVLVATVSEVALALIPFQAVSLGDRWGSEHVHWADGP